jgi:hypothetical protein
VVQQRLDRASHLLVLLGGCSERASR